jgi:hypothetical protein
MLIAKDCKITFSTFGSDLAFGHILADRVKRFGLSYELCVLFCSVCNVGVLWLNGSTQRGAIWSPVEQDSVGHFGGNTGVGSSFKFCVDMVHFHAVFKIYAYV